MWKCKYPEEPFDLRLLCVRLRMNIPKILLISLAGCLLFGGIYCVKNILLGPADTYTAKTSYWMNYETPPTKDNAFFFLHTEEWNNRVHADEFLEKVLETFGNTLEREALSQALSAEVVLQADYRMLDITVTTADPVLSLQISDAVKAAFPGYASGMEELSSLLVMDASQKAEKVFHDVRPARAFILGFVLSLFFTVVIFLAYEIGNDKIWLPSTLSKRYALPALEPLGTPGFGEDFRYHFAPYEKINVLCADPDLKPSDLFTLLHADPRLAPLQGKWALSFVEDTEAADNVSSLNNPTAGTLFIAKAGTHNSRHIEALLDRLHKHDCPITAALLWTSSD